jgi:hypothetical protein
MAQGTTGRLLNEALTCHLLPSWPAGAAAFSKV